MRTLVKGIAFALLTFPLFVSAEAVTADLSPTQTQQQLAIDILENLSANHYRKRNLDDQFSEELYSSYIDTLDPFKSYFLVSDLKNLAKWQRELDNHLKSGNLEFGFSTFKLYQQIALDQLQRNIDLLESEYQFDFDDQEFLVVDAELRSHPETPEQRNDIWRKRMEDALLRLKLSNKDISEARELLVKRYKSQIKQLKETESQDVFQLYGNTITTLYDPHTNYLSPRNSENFNINMSLSLEGIGAVLQREDEHIKVVRIVPGGPADKQGQLKAGDKIVGVQQGEDGENVDVIGWRLDDAVALIRGPKASTVVLQVSPRSAESADVTSTIKIIRDTVKLEEQAAQSQIIDVPNGDQVLRIGVIDLPTFYLDFDAYRNRDPNTRSSTRDVYNLLTKLDKEDVDGIILDLRGNGGGSLLEATQLSDLFINPGPVVQIRNSKDKVDRRQRARQGAYYRGPMLVLIDRLSASASEIFAGAIQDYERGIIIGTQSFGKGTVQSLLPLRDGSQLKLTESKFYRVSGDSTQNRGIIPDISLPGEFPIDQAGESNYDHALPWDSIPPAPFRKLDDLSVYIPRLKALHNDRAANDPDLIHLSERLQLTDLYRQQDKTRVSLNETERKASREDRENAALELENRRRVAKGMSPFADVKAWRNESEATEEDEGQNSDVTTDGNSENSSEENSGNSEGANKRDDMPISETDPRLMEAGRILADFIDLKKSERLVQQQ